MYRSALTKIEQGWRISRHDAGGGRGVHIRFENTRFAEGPLFRAALGPEARDAQEGFQWDRNGQSWWVAVAAVARYVQDEGREILEEDVTDSMVEEVVRAGGGSPSDNE